MRKKFRVWDERFKRMCKKPEQIRLNIANGNVHGSRSGGNVETWKLLQYTGIDDVDGVEVCEGDILEVKIGCWKQDKPYVVEDLRELYLETNRDDRYYRITSMKIIGNIYENPELIEANHGQE